MLGQGIKSKARKAVGKTKTRSQLCLLGTDDGRIIEVELSVLKGCAAHDEWCSAWLLDADNQINDENTGHSYQILDERSTIPISVITALKIKDLTELINGIFHESWVMDLVQAGRDKAKDKARAWLYVILGIPIILGALILGIAVLRG